MSSNKETIKKFLKGLGISDEEELNEFSEKLLEKWASDVTPRPIKNRARIWTKEEIEEQGIEVKPVKWKKL